jgi:hypothetical protein
MGAACAALTARVAHRSSPTARTAYHPQCDFLSAAYRRCVALLTARLAALADGVNGLITNDKFCWTRRSILSLTWPRSYPLPRAWRQDLPEYAPLDDRVYRHRRGGQHASSPPTILAPAPSAVSSPRRTAALGSSLSAPRAMGAALAADAARARTGGGRQP